MIAALGLYPALAWQATCAATTALIRLMTPQEG